MNSRIMKLKTLLETPAYSGLNAEVQLAAVNLRDKPYNKPLSKLDLLKWAATGGRAASIKRVSEDNTGSVSDQSIAWAAMRMIEDDLGFDIDNSEIAALVNALVSRGIIDAADRTALADKAAVIGSDAEKFGIVDVGGEVYLGHINQAQMLING